MRIKHFDIEVLWGVLCVLAAVAIVGILFSCKCIEYTDPHWETITVKEKTISIGQSRSYLVYSEYEVYEIQDLMFVGFFTSSDVFSAIEPGNTYRVYVRGKRIPFLSSYKNIIEVRNE